MCTFLADASKYGHPYDDAVMTDAICAWKLHASPGVARAWFCWQFCYFKLTTAMLNKAGGILRGTRRLQADCRGSGHANKCMQPDVEEIQTALCVHASNVSMHALLAGPESAACIV